MCVQSAVHHLCHECVVSRSGADWQPVLNFASETNGCNNTFAGSGLTGIVLHKPWPGELMGAASSRCFYTRYLS